MQHVYLFEGDLSMEIISSRHVDNVLRYAHAFILVRKDKDLIKQGFRPGDYSRLSDTDSESSWL